MNWMHAALAWVNHPHGVVLVGVIVLGVVACAALWPLRRSRTDP